MAGFRASFRKDDELQHCGEATDLAFICKGNGEISEHWQRCTRDSKPMPLGFPGVLCVVLEDASRSE